MNAISTKIAAFWISRRAQARLTARVTIAGVAAFALIHLLGLTQGYWVVLTAVLVVQSSVGGSLKAAIDRVIGTAGGAFYGAAVALVMPHGGFVETGAALAVGLAPTAFMAAYNPGFRIAPVTVVIVLLSATSGAGGIMHYAYARVGEIVLGSLLGLAISLTVLPSRAHGQAAEAAGRVLDLFAGLLADLLETGRQARDHAAIQQRLAGIRAALGKLDTIADEARRERLSYLSGAPDPEPLLQAVRRIRHDLVIINHATIAALPEGAAALAAPMAAIGAGAGGLLRAVAMTLHTAADHPVPEGWEAGFDAFAAALDGVRQAGTLARGTVDEAGRVFALAFALGQLRHNLKELAARAGEINHHTMKR